MSANSIWVQPSFEILDSYISTIKEIYNVDVFYESLATNSGINTLNSWCNSKTNGIIPKLLFQPTNIPFAIINANYFNGNWSTKFDAKNTKDATFTNSDGKKVLVKTMNTNSLTVSYFENQSLKAIVLPYGNTAYSMTLLMSTENNNIPNISQNEWNTIQNSFYPVDCKIAIPKFRLSYKQNISQILSAIGLKETLGDNPNFSKFSNQTSQHEILQISDITVDEQGTKASAVSADMIFISNGNSHIKNCDFIVNKPFMFIISEKSTGTILYMAAVNSFN